MLVKSSLPSDTSRQAAAQRAKSAKLSVQDGKVEEKVLRLSASRSLTIPNRVRYPGVLVFALENYANVRKCNCPVISTVAQIISSDAKLQWSVVMFVLPRCLYKIRADDKIQLDKTKV